MMRNLKFVYCFVRISVCYLLLCGNITGCGIRDSVIEIPLNETKESLSVSVEEEVEKEISESQPSVIHVYVCGAVVQPGVVKLPEGSRAEDALREAGGFSEEARRDYVNLAAKVADGEKLYFPSLEEAEELVLAEEAEQQGLVNINTAGLAQLMTLPGIGEVRGQDIIDYREENGAFQSKEELQNVSGIKGNIYEELCDKIIVE